MTMIVYRLAFFVGMLLPLTVSCNKKELPAAQSTAGIAQGNQPEQPLQVVAKKAHLAPQWYAQDPVSLGHELDEYLDLALKKCYVEADPEAVRALVVPHAGLYYSGFCAATAYQTLLMSKNLFGSAGKNNKIDHVIILAPDHRGMSFGVTLPPYTEYHLPLGVLQVNQQAIAYLQGLKIAKVATQEHDLEHALEMQLPWLQRTIEKFTITPLLVGNIDQYDAKEFARNLKNIITPNTLLVVTSDFTHHGASYRYRVFNEHIVDYVRALDSAVIETIFKADLAGFDDLLDKTQATVCGRHPLKVLLALLGEGLLGSVEGRLGSYYTSAHLNHARKDSFSINVADLVGDLADDEAQESVSYAGLIFSAQRISDLLPENQLTSFEKRSLTTLARESIENELAGNQRITPPLLWPLVSPGLNKAQGVFVTLHDKEDKLRGCIGRIAAFKPLYQTTQDMALAAAFKDERFMPLNKEDLESVTLSLTLLSQPERIFALSNIVLGRHGIILNKFKEDGTLAASSVFLPQVPASLGWDLATTLAELSKKAGLGPDGWCDNSELQVFEGYEIKEMA